MKNNTIWTSKYFCGKEISAYGLQNNRVDYATLAAAFDAVLNNNIISVTGWENWEQENGFVDNSDEIEKLEEQRANIETTLSDIENGLTENIDPAEVDEMRERLDEITDEIEALEDDENYLPDVYQWYIIDDNGARLLEEYTNEIVYYNDELDMYVWGVTHFGTSWAYVLTDIKVDLSGREA